MTDSVFPVPRTTIPREVTRKLKLITADMLRDEATAGSGLTEVLTDKYGIDVIEAALMRLADRIEAL